MTATRAPRKIVMVSQHFAPDPSTTATYLTAIANGLRQDGEVLVISGTAHSASTPASGTAQPRVVELKTWTPEKDALVRRAIAMALFSVRTFFATLKHVKAGDVVLCVTTPFALPYLVTLATKLRKASAVLLIYDLYPEALVMAGLVRPQSLVARAIRFANGLLFAALDTIITIGRDVEALLLAYGKVTSDRINSFRTGRCCRSDTAKYRPAAASVAGWPESLSSDCRATWDSRTAPARYTRPHGH